MNANPNSNTSSNQNNPPAVPQPDLLIQFIGTLVDCDPAEGTMTFHMRALPPSQVEAFGRFADKHIRAETQVLVLTYDLGDFTEYNKQIAVQLKAEKSGGAS